MKIEITNRLKGNAIISGDYNDIKDCLEKNRGAYLRDADLGGAYLGGAHLGGAHLGGADLGGAYLGDAYLRGADLGGAYLGDAYLGGADLGDAYLGGAHLRGADLRGADLRGADLRGADLRGAKNYKGSHDIFKEVVRRQPVNTFIVVEWVAIGEIIVHTLCWDAISKRFGNVMGHIFNVLADEGFPEWQDYWKEINK